MADGWLKKPYDLAGKKIWVAGSQGMVGSAVLRRLQREDIAPSPRLILHNLKSFSSLCEKREGRGGSSNRGCEIDLREQAAVHKWMQQNKPDIIVLAAAKVGGIKANSDNPAAFLYDNLMIQSNVIHAAYEAGVEKLLFLGSSCIYPRKAMHPITEDALLTGPLEPTNEPYAIAKIAGIKLCQSYRRQYGCDFIAAMPCNLYGPGDKFDPENSHVIPALIRKFHEAKITGAKKVTLWGSGKPLREFLYVDDLAKALVFLLRNYTGENPVNVGSGEEISIMALADKIAAVVGFEGEIKFDPSKPDGTPRKLMDSSRINQAGWRAGTSLEEGLQQTCAWYQEQIKRLKAA